MLDVSQSGKKSFTETKRFIYFMNKETKRFIYFMNK